jgi:hypothetical protein
MLERLEQQKKLTANHRRSSAHRSPAGSFFGGFRTPVPLYRVERSRRAGIRNP